MVNSARYSRKNDYLCTELIQRDMNLRDIKKDIEYVIGAFVDDCTLFLNVANLIDKAVDLFNDLREKVAKSAGAEKPKVCFTSIRKELFEKTDALYDELSAAVKKGLGE